jgi:hypothetical protein
MINNKNDIDIDNLIKKYKLVYNKSYQSEPIPCEIIKDIKEYLNKEDNYSNSEEIIKKDSNSEKIIKKDNNYNIFKYTVTYGTINTENYAYILLNNSNENYELVDVKEVISKDETPIVPRKLFNSKYLNDNGYDKKDQMCDVSISSGIRNVQIWKKK